MGCTYCVFVTVLTFEVFWLFLFCKSWKCFFLKISVIKKLHPNTALVTLAGLIVRDRTGIMLILMTLALY